MTDAVAAATAAGRAGDANALPDGKSSSSFGALGAAHT